jgi:hypothetical protein
MNRRKKNLQKIKKMEVKKMITIINNRSNIKEINIKVKVNLHQLQKLECNRNIILQ